MTDIVDCNNAANALHYFLRLVLGTIDCAIARSCWGRAIYGESEALNLRRLSRKVPGPGAELPITYFAHKTAAVRDDRVCTRCVLAARDIAAKRRGAAGLNSAHHLQLCVAHVPAVGVTPSGTEVAEDIRDFQSGALHECAQLLRRILLGP